MTNVQEIIWKDIKGFEGIYQVSNTGLVKSLSREIALNRGGKYVTKEKICSPSYDQRGYKQLVLTNKHHKRVGRRIHRFVAENFIPNPDNKREVNHIDGNKLNNHVNNLEWCTSKENIQHAFRIGIKQPITADVHGLSKKVLNTESNKIYFSISAAASDLGISPSYLSNMLSGKAKNKTSFIYA